MIFPASEQVTEQVTEQVKELVKYRIKRWIDKRYKAIIFRKNQIYLKFNLSI